MVKVYVIHSKDFNFKEELYKPLRESVLNSQYQFVFPHEQGDGLFDSKSLLKNERTLVLVEASFPKIGVGIEVGWANAYERPVIVMVRKGYRLSPSLQSVCDSNFEYEGPEDMTSKLKPILEQFVL